MRDAAAASGITPCSPNAGLALGILSFLRLSVKGKRKQRGHERAHLLLWPGKDAPEYRSGPHCELS